MVTRDGTIRIHTPDRPPIPDGPPHPVDDPPPDDPAWDECAHTPLIDWGIRHLLILAS